MAGRRITELSGPRKRIIEVLENFHEQNGYSPSMREICEEAQISSTSLVNYHLKHLEEMGYILRDKHVARGIKVLKPILKSDEERKPNHRRAGKSIPRKKVEVDEIIRVPLWGRIVAGSPIPVPSSDFPSSDFDLIDVPRSFLSVSKPDAHNLFALEVQGDSMIDAMVNDGDIVIMEPPCEARNGDMVALWLIDKSETTLKLFFRENGRLRLQPANPRMDPIIVDDPSTVTIQGKVLLTISKYVRKPDN